MFIVQILLPLYDNQGGNDHLGPLLGFQVNQNEAHRHSEIVSKHLMVKEANFVQDREWSLK